MIKSAVQNHWKEADKILKDIKSGKNFFSSGGDYDEILPQRFLAFYYYVIGDEIYDDEMNIKINNGKFLYLVIKTLFYYLTLIFFSKIIIKTFPLKNCFFIIFFLAFEPSIFQYHSSFWNEALFFPFQILLLSFIFLKYNNFTINLFIGLMLGMMFMISQEVFFYFIPLIFYFLLIFKRKSAKPIFGLIIGYLIVLSMISFHNFKRVGVPYFMPYGSKTALYLYFAPEILALSKNLSVSQAETILTDKKILWVKNNNININQKNENKFNDIGEVENKKDELKYHKYLQKLALGIIIKNPISTLEYLLSKNLHTLVLDPFYVKYFYKYDARGKNKFYKSKIHQDLIPYRIVYTIVVYLIMFIGLIYSLKNMKKEICLILIIFALYPIIVLGWMGVNRYFVPALIFLSIFFGNGISTIFNAKQLKR